MGSRIRKSRRGRSRSRSRSRKSLKTRKLRQRRSPYKLRRRLRSPRFFNFRRLSPQFAPTPTPTPKAPQPTPKAPTPAAPALTPIPATPTPTSAAPALTLTPQPEVKVLLQVQPIRIVSASEIVIQRAASQKIAQSALASQLEAHKEADRQRLLSLQSVAEQQANDLKSKKVEGKEGEKEGEGEGEGEGKEGEKDGKEGEGEERPLVPALNAAGPQCGSLVCRKREKCIEGICTKTRLNVNFPNDDDLEEIRIIDNGA